MKPLPTLGQSELQVHPVVLGTFAIGGWWWGPQSSSDALEAIRAHLDAGANGIDTAPMYGFGRAEEIIGEALKGRQQQAVVMTKTGLRWDGIGTPFFPARHEGKKYQVCFDSTPTRVREECHLSLKRLGIDCIDLYQVHWPDPSTPIEDTMGEMLRLKEEGKIRAVGVSNFSQQQIEEAQRSLGDEPLTSIQPRYSLLHRKIESSVLPYCREENIGVISYRPMEQGLLTGKVGPERRFESGDERTTQSIFSIENRQAIARAFEKLTPILETHNLTKAQLSIAWVLHQAGVSAALCGARNAEQAHANAQSANASLSASEERAIQAAFAELPIRAPRAT